MRSPLPQHFNSDVLAAGSAIDEGKALLLVVNKVDRLSRQQQGAIMEGIASYMEERFLEAGRLPCFAVSALTGEAR